MCDDGETLIEERKNTKYYELYNNLNSINYAYQKYKTEKFEILILLKEMRAVDSFIIEFLVYLQ